MTHREASGLLTDLLMNRVAEPRASAAWRHVAACPECRDAITAMHEVREAVDRAGVALFDRHPTSSDIVRFALGDSDLGMEDRLRIDAHLRQCDACAHEVQVTREAETATRRPSPWRGMVSSGHWTLPHPSLAAALAVMLALLAYPAYVGITRHPQLVKTHGATTQELSELREHDARIERELAARPKIAELYGPTQLLVLPAATRDGTHHPRFILGPDRALVPVVIQHRPFSGAARGTVTLRLLGEGGREAWRGEYPARDLWDESIEAMVVLVPGQALEEGSQRLVVQYDGSIVYESTFTITRPRR